MCSLYSIISTSIIFNNPLDTQLQSHEHATEYIYFCNNEDKHLYADDLRKLRIFFNAGNAIKTNKSIF